MTDKKLMRQIVELYGEARKTTFPKKNIQRGRIHSVSSKVEDLFALYISDMISNDYKLLIDQSFTYYTNKKHTIYPDIALIKDNVVMKLFDIKMDLGWKRDFTPFCNEKQTQIDEIRGISVCMKDVENDDERTLTISKKIKLNIVVVSNTNISQEKRGENEKNILNLDKNKIEVFILTDVHPNDYAKKKLTDIPLRQLDFEKLKKEVSKC